MTNVQQFAPRPGTQLAVDVANRVRWCLALAASYSKPHLRMRALEIMLKHGPHSQHVRQALGTQSEMVATLESLAAVAARIKRQEKPVADTIKQPESRVVQFQAKRTDEQPESKCSTGGLTMSNAIQFADKKRAIITARGVQFCLAVVGWDMWADRPKARPKVLETLLKDLDVSERVRLALRELGEEIGCTRSHLSEVENGKTTIGLVLLLKLCRVLGASPGSILNESGQNALDVKVYGLADLLGSKNVGWLAGLSSEQIRHAMTAARRQINLPANTASEVA